MMDRSHRERQRPRRRLVLTTWCGCLILAATTTTTTRAFHSTLSSISTTVTQSTIAVTSSLTVPPQPFISSSFTTRLHMSSRKGNRGSAKAVSTNTSKRTRPQVNDVLSSITSPPSFPYSVDPADLPPGPASDDPLVPFVHTIVKAADMRKASDISAVRVTPCTSLTNFVIIITGTSRPQNQAIANAIVKDVEQYHSGMRCLGNGIPEGSADSGWILLDYGDVMVHVMTPKSRLFYDMEGVWRKRGGESLDLSNVLVGEDGGNNSSSLRELSIDSSGGGGGDDDDDDDDDDNFAFYGEEDDEVDEEEEDEAYDDDEDDGTQTSMRERLNVEKEIDPFWS